MDVKMALLTEMYFDEEDLTQYWVPVLEVRGQNILVLDENSFRLVPFMGDKGTLTQVAVVDSETYDMLLEFHGRGTQLSKMVGSMIDPYREGA